MSQINVRNLSNENDDGAPDIVGVSTFSATSYFVPPVGDTAQRPENPQPGDLRFNTDSASLEYYRGDTIGWEQIEMKEAAPIGARGLAMGGYNHTNLNTIEYIEIATTGNAKDFGDLTETVDTAAVASSTTRAVRHGGYDGSGNSDVQDYVQIATLGNAVSFSDTLNSFRNRAACGDSTRGIWMGGFSTTDEISYITFSSAGTDIDFGNLTASRYNTAGLSSSTRGISAGGSTPYFKNIDYITIQSTGNAVDFGDLSTVSGFMKGCSSPTRGVISWNGNSLEYITIASTGDGVDFGDTYSSNNKGLMSSHTRGIVLGGSPSYINTIEYFTIQTLGNSSDFGDLTAAKMSSGNNSNAHGGL